MHAWSLTESIRGHRLLLAESLAKPWRVSENGTWSGPRPPLCSAAPRCREPVSDSLVRRLYPNPAILECSIALNCHAPRRTAVRPIDIAALQQQPLQTGGVACERERCNAMRGCAWVRSMFAWIS